MVAPVGAEDGTEEVAGSAGDFLGRIKMQPMKEAIRLRHGPDLGLSFVRGGKHEVSAVLRPVAAALLGGLIPASEQWVRI